MTTITNFAAQHNYNITPYLVFGKNIITQNGEDGIIEQLFLELGITQGVVMEFGAWDGVHLSNTLRLWETGNFDALLVESDTNRYKQLQKFTRKHSNVETQNCCVSKDSHHPNSVDNLLANSKFNVTDDTFALISIDVDSIDYHIFKSMVKFRPKIVIVECINGGPMTEYVSSKGSSLLSLANLGKEKGYTLVCYTLNAIMVRDDLISQLHHYSPTIPLLDYYTPVSKFLQHIDETGMVTNQITYKMPKYINRLQKKRKELI